jgi:hypothetical protein
MNSLKLFPSGLDRGRQRNKARRRAVESFPHHIVRRRAVSLAQIDPPLRQLPLVLEKNIVGARNDSFLKLGMLQ